MLDNDKKMQVLDLTVTIILFIVGCFLGKYIMKYHDTWFAFNGSVFAVVILGGLVWWRVRKIVLQKLEEKK